MAIGDKKKAVMQADIDTTTLSNDSTRVPASSVVKSAIDSVKGGWNLLTYEAGYTDQYVNNRSAYRKDGNNMVYVHLCSTASTDTADQIIAYLPVGYRPSYLTPVLGYNANHGIYLLCFITSAGAIRARAFYQDGVLKSPSTAFKDVNAEFCYKAE